MSEFKRFGWMDLSTAQKPSYALILRQTTSGEDDKLVKFHGMWMTAKQARVLKQLNKDTASIDESLTMPAAMPAALPTDIPTAIDEPLPPKFPIMDLPHELRRLILEYDAIEFLQKRSRNFRIPVYLRGVHGPPTAIRLPPVTQAGDRQLRLEAIHVTIELATLEIHSGPANAKLQKWLASIDFQGSGNTRLSQGFEAVKSLLFPYFSRFPYYIPCITANNDIELMKRCTNLRTVSLQWVSAELWYNGQSKSVERLRTEFRLDGMLDLTKLEILTLNGPGEGRMGNLALKELVEWFKDEYKQRGRATKVVLT